MDTSIVSEINRLRQMTVCELRVEWQRLYGEESRSRNKDFLWRRLAWRIQELQLGGLADAAKARIVEIAPATFIRTQLPPSFRPQQPDVQSPGPTAARRDSRLPSPGSTLVRRYKGEDIRVLVHTDGFEWDGRQFDTLSEAAFAVTGSRWNGWLFFGLTKRTRGR